MGAPYEVLMEVPAGLADAVRSILEEDHLPVRDVSGNDGLMDGVLTLGVALTAVKLVEIGLKIYNHLRNRVNRDEDKNKITVKVQVGDVKTTVEIDLRQTQPTIELRLKSLQSKLSKTA